MKRIAEGYEPESKSDHALLFEAKRLQGKYEEAVRQGKGLLIVSRFTRARAAWRKVREACEVEK